MPQLSPMLGVFIFLSVLALLFVFITSMDKATLKVQSNLKKEKVYFSAFRTFDE